MPQLTEDRPRVFKTDLNVFGTLPVAASTTIYEGSAVGLSSGNARQLVANDPFYGFCEKKVASTAADVVEVRKRGVVTINVAGVTGNGNIGATVYASDGDTFTLTATGNSPIGKVSRRVSGETCEVFFESVDLRSL